MILRYELKKVWNKRVNKVALAVALVAVVAFAVFAIGSMRFVDQEGNLNNGVTAGRSLSADKAQWQGELTPDAISQAIEQYRAGDWQSTYDIVFLASKMLQGEVSESSDIEAALAADGARIDAIYESYRANLQAACEEYGDTPAQVDYLAERYRQIETPFVYEPADTWDTMLLYATTIGIVLSLIVGFMAAGIFAEEFRSRSDAVFFSTRKGRSAATWAKVCTGLIVATVVYWAGVGILSAAVFAVAGASGASAPYQVIQPYSIYTITYAQAYGMVVLGGYVASLLSAAVCMLVASKAKKESVAVCVPFVLFCVSPFLGRALPFKAFFTLTPDQLTNVMNCLRVPYVYQMGDTVFSQMPFLFLLYGAIALVLILLAGRVYSKSKLQ